MSESSARAWEDNPITLLGLGVLDGTVDGDTLNRWVRYRRNPGQLDQNTPHKELKRHRRLGIPQGWGLHLEEIGQEFSLVVSRPESHTVDPRNLKDRSTEK